MISSIKKDVFYEFEYTNYQNEKEYRKVLVNFAAFGSNEYYLEPQFFLHCSDYSRGREGTMRTFAIANITPGTFQQCQPSPR